MLQVAKADFDRLQQATPASLNPAEKAIRQSKTRRLSGGLH
jgi:hypothetical protein